MAVFVLAQPWLSWALEETTPSLTLQDAATSAVNGTAVEVSKYNTLTLTISGISGDIITFEVTGDGTGASGWVSKACAISTTGALSSTATANASYQCNVAGYAKFRARISTYGAGTITVTGRASTALASAIAAGGGMTGSGTANTLSKFTGSSTLGNSLATDDGSSLTYTGTGIIFGASPAIMLLEKSITGGEQATGPRISGQSTNGNLNIVASSDTGTAALKVVGAYYNGAAWYSAIEWANVAGGGATRGTLSLMKSGGTVTSGATNTVFGGTAGTQLFNLQTGNTAAEFPFAVINTNTTVGARTGLVYGLLSNSSFAGTTILGGIEIEYRGATAKGDLVFYTNPSSSNTERMRLDNAGNLGVGKTAASGVKLDVNGLLNAVLYGSATNCSSSAAPAVCSAAPAGSVVIAAAGTAVTVNTTAVTAASQIFIQEDSSLGTKLSVTCNTTTGRTYTVSARTAATSFTVTSSAAPTTNPACLSYFIIN